MKSKKCIKCYKTKLLKKFYKHSGMKDGHLNKCIDCCKIDVRLNYRLNIDHYAIYEKKRASLPHRKIARDKYAAEHHEKIYEIKKRWAKNNKDKVIKSHKKWLLNNKGKRKAHSILNYAIRKGEIIKKACSVCEAIKVDAHHDDYFKPLDVIWLCRKHHLEYHKKKESS